MSFRKLRSGGGGGGFFQIGKIEPIIGAPKQAALPVFLGSRCWFAASEVYLQ